MLDELKEIEEIINKLDSINPDDWNRREDETEEEFEERIQNIEEEIEEELIDVISDSLLNEQELNEEEAVKEAREKIEKEYEIYQDAFERDSNGSLTLKSREELAKLGYESAEEIEKLTAIANNYNDPESYIESIRTSIKAQKDIDAEIERKMEVAKVYISAKLRGEEPVIPSNEAKTKKYEDNNEYIRTTRYLNKVPVVQNELINNNRLIARSYVPYIPNVPRNSTMQTGTISETARVTASNVVRPRTTVTNPVKVQVLRNVENKMDSTNDLSKQKIKSRTELKRLFKEYENRELNENELNELKAKIGDIEKKYPNTITDKSLNKLYDTFNVKITVDKSKEIGYTGSKKQEPGKKTSELQQELNEGLGVSGSVAETIPVAEPVTTETTAPSATPVIKDTARKIALGAIGIGEAIGKFTQKSGEKIESIIKKQQEQARKRRTARKRDDKLSVQQAKNKEHEEQISRIIEAGSEKDVDIRKINYIDIKLMSEYLKKNKDLRGQKAFDHILKKLEDFTGSEFLENIDGFDEYFDIRLLEQMHKLYLNGIVSADGTVIINRNKEKAKKYILKELEYIMHLKNKANTKSDNPIENLKNEARFNKIITDVSTTSLIEKYPSMELMMTIEELKRIQSKYTQLKYESIIKEYKKKMDENKEISFSELEVLGNVLYNGIKTNNGLLVVSPDKIEAKRIYEKLAERFPDKRSEETYSRLLDLYEDNTLPIYDIKKAREIAKIMQEKGVKRKSSLEQNVKQSRNKGSVYVCSDLHGQYEVYRAIMDSIDKDDKIYILGDVIDRGPDGIKILQDIMKRQEKGQVQFIMGNHEHMMLNAILGDKNQEELWVNRNGGRSTYDKYKGLPKENQDQIREFLMDSLIYEQIRIKDQEYHLVHAKSIDYDGEKRKTYRQMIKEGKIKDVDEAVWSRAGKEYKSSEIGKKGIFTIIGHTPTESGLIEEKDECLYIDCGAAYQYGAEANASLVNLTEGKVEYFNAEAVRMKSKESKIQEK